MGYLALCRIGWEALDVQSAGRIGGKLHREVVGRLRLLHGRWVAMDISRQGDRMAQGGGGRVGGDGFFSDSA